MTQEKINQFADVTGDHQWIHIDIERCKKESPFGGPVAHGFLTLSLLPAFKNTDEYTVTGFRNVVNYGANKLRFVSPVPAGASVHARSRLIAVEPRPMGTMLTRETEIQVVGTAEAGGGLRSLDAFREVGGRPVDGVRTDYL